MGVNLTVAELDQQIKELEEKKKEVLEQEQAEFTDKWFEFINGLSLTEREIKKILSDADAEKIGKKKVRKPRKPRKVSTFKEKPCAKCGKMFVPTSGRQTVCEECKAAEIENKDIDTKEETIK